ncbi:MAG: DUF616 domain-containing protein, partial [Candidatus Omnitrophica bacterium]|nr:DUF616 domain-containing protein [Candidatus Omnitrophota bacterium]
MYHKNENWIDIFADFINFFTTSLLWYLREGSKNRIVVYTAIFGDYDDLRPPKNIFRKINCVDYICFTDNEKLRSDVWDIKIIPGSDHRSLRLCAKEYRIFPHKYFSRYKYSIWIDGNRELFCDPRYLILKYLKSENFALFKHDLNGSIYEEGAHCKLWKKDLEDCINSQLEKYRKENFPAHFGCAVTSVILRKHNAEEVVNLMQKWWIEITEQSERDQISLMYVVWKNNMPIKIIPNAGRLNKWFPRRCHK